MPRLHIGNGPVYLTPSVATDPEGWINCDVRGDHTALASERPDLVEQLSTTDDAYYARHEDKTIEKLRQGPQSIKGVCDQYGDCLSTELATHSVTEILARQVFEHLSIREARLALAEFDRVLQAGGILRLDVPEVEETALLLQETKDPFYIRHLFGSRRDEYGYHLHGYTRESLKTLVEEFAFVLEEEEKNPHFYPAFTLRFRKLQVIRAPYEYTFQAANVQVGPGWKCLEIGPGTFPWPRADVYCDINPDFNPKTGKPFHQGDLNERLPFQDKEFDFLYCSHVLEHVEDPIKACAELSRVAHRGLIATPHPFKEALGAFEEGDHKWMVWPTRRSDPRGLIFEPLFETRVSELRDSDVQKALSRIFRTGPCRMDHDLIVLRRWFYENEHNLDTIHYWEGQINIQVLEGRV